jgi:hypothetical protein
MSPTSISVSRRQQRLTTVGIAAVFALLGAALPALGGPAATPGETANKALEVANAAMDKAEKALLLATRGAANESITSAKIANLTIKAEDIAANAIGTGKVAKDALTLDDVAGADVVGAITLPAIAAHECFTGAIQVGGAEPGDVPLFVWQDQDKVPAGLMFEIVKITGKNTGTFRACNVRNAPSAAVKNLGCRVITFR